ncbi:hypothetical protein [Krasilnikovia sp. M28-CT-15]|uniref:hypothetical protein n=1 Tax=Krasilnikovia sp. M28-CT-15 TaxID=3373540 RepID=UPI003876B9DC
MAEVGRFIAGSNYSGFDVKQLFTMVDAAASNLAPSHAQVDALNRAQQTLNAHGQALKNARAQLALRWPPETNAASNAYLVELDRLIAAVDDTALNCAVNAAHINLVSNAIVESRKTLKPLHDEYVANESALAQYEQEVHDFGDGAKDIPFGKSIAEGAKRLFSDPPVADGRQDELTQRVRREMTALAGAAQDGAARIQPPTPYEPPRVNGGVKGGYPDPGGNGGGGGGSSGGAVRPPRIDPPAHTRPSTEGGVSGDIPAPSGHGGGAVVPSPIAGANPLPSGVQPGPSGSGPGLAGGIASPVLPPPVQQVPAPGVGPVPAPPTGPGVPVPGLFPGVLPGAGGPPAGPGLGLVGPGGRIVGGVPGGQPGMVAGQSGPLGGLRNGVIGGVPGVGGAPGAGGVPGAGGLRAGAGARPRINPVGGVISQQHEPAAGSPGRGAAGRPAGRAGMAEPGPAGRAAGPAGMAGAAGARRGRSGDPDEGQRWDPDNPWAAAEGVDAVIAPDQASGHVDPGPGIIGLHR